MNYITHSLGGVAAGMLVAPFVVSGTNEIATAAVYSGAVIGSLFPDIDHTRSWMGRKAPITSHVVAAVTKHRGFTHSPVFVAIMWIVITAGIQVLPGEYAMLAQATLYGFVPGMLSHLILDSFNKQGVPWLWPKDKRYRICNIRTDSIAEWIFRVCLAAIICIAIIPK